MERHLRSATGLVVGLDLSEAVVAAADLTADLPAADIVRGGLLRLPFHRGSFDHINSIGVFDHTSDLRGAAPSAWPAAQARRTHPRITNVG